MDIIRWQRTGNRPLAEQANECKAAGYLTSCHSPHIVNSWNKRLPRNTCRTNTTQQSRA